MTHYRCTLESGRDFILNNDEDDIAAAYAAEDEACLMDDYLVNIEPLHDA